MVERREDYTECEFTDEAVHRAVIVRNQIERKLNLRRARTALNDWRKYHLPGVPVDAPLFRLALERAKACSVTIHAHKNALERNGLHVES